MRSHRGVTLVELLATLPLMAAVLVVISVLFPRVVRDVPSLYRVVQTGDGISHLARAIREDVDAGIAMPPRAVAKTAGSGILLIQLSKRTICYEIDRDEVIRTEMSPDGSESKITNSWSLPKAEISFHLWRSDGRAYAVEMRSGVKYVTQGRTEDKLVNTRVYFLGALNAAGGRA